MVHIYIQRNPLAAALSLQLHPLASTAPTFVGAETPCVLTTARGTAGWLCASDVPSTNCVRLHTTSPSVSTAAAAHGFIYRAATTVASAVQVCAVRTLCGPTARTATASYPRLPLTRPPMDRHPMRKPVGLMRAGTRWCREARKTSKYARTSTRRRSCWLTTPRQTCTLSSRGKIARWCAPPRGTSAPSNRAIEAGATAPC